VASQTFGGAAASNCPLLDPPLVPAIPPLIGPAYLTHSVYTKYENSCVVAKTKPQSVITTTRKKHLSPHIDTMVGWFIAILT